MIRECTQNDFQAILGLINRASRSYRGKIPTEFLEDAYMSAEELHDEISNGVRFYGFEDRGKLVGVTGIQEVQDATLIRHAYVEPERQSQGVGGKLLSYLKGLAKTSKVLVGTWAANDGAVKFYKRYGFRLLDQVESQELLSRYWSISNEQSEASVVLRMEQKGESDASRA